MIPRLDGRRASAVHRDLPILKRSGDRRVHAVTRGVSDAVIARTLNRTGALVVEARRVAHLVSMISVACYAQNISPKKRKKPVDERL